MEWGDYTWGVSSATEVTSFPVIGGIECHYLAFRTKDVDFQIWIAQGAKPHRVSDVARQRRRCRARSRDATEESIASMLTSGS